MLRFVGALALIALATGVPIGCSGGVVGGDCRSGLSLCHGRCVDLRTDGDHCGACDNACGPGEECVSGACEAGGSGGRDGGTDAAAGGDASVDGPLPDGASRDSSVDGSTADRDAGDAVAAGGDSGTGGRDGSTGGRDGGTGGTGGRDAGGTGGTGGTGGRDGGTGGAGGLDGGLPDGPTCVPPFDTPAQCGDCNTVCVAPDRLCTPSDGGFACTPLCTPPLVECAGQCVDTNSDPRHCGRCNNRCVTNLCQAGQCVGARAGNVVAMCMDYRTRMANTPQNQLLGNSVFLAFAEPVRVLAYRQYTPNVVVNQVTRVLDEAAANRGRSYTLTTSSVAAEVASDLNTIDYDVLLVLDQPNAPSGSLSTIGTSWAAPIDAFLRSGGTVVVLAGDQGRGEMPALLTSAGLLPVTAQTNVEGQQLSNRAPADAVGINVLTPFLALPSTCTFTTSATPDTATVFVVTDAPASSGMLGAPVVVHRVVVP